MMKERRGWNRRHSAIFFLVVAVLILIVLSIVGLVMPKAYYEPNFSAKSLFPSLEHFFGTDFMGRDMFWRTIKGLSTSVWIGVLATIVSSIMGVIIGLCAGTMGKFVDGLVNWTVDLFMSVPHLVFQVLLCVIMGKGLKGITFAVIITHWPTLARLVRAEVLTLRSAQYIQASQRMGKSRMWIAINHIAPHILPQFIIGLVILFPHAIMHEASITFLGFGIPPEIPAIGSILSESMGYLTSGMWWLTILPGASLLFVVLLFEVIGEQAKRLLDPMSTQE